MNMQGRDIDNLDDAPSHGRGDSPEPDLIIRKLIAGTCVNDLINDHLDRIAGDDEFFDDDWQHNRIHLGDHGKMMAYIAPLMREARFAYTLDSDTWIGLARSGPQVDVRVEEYHVDVQMDCSAVGAACKVVSSSVLRNGEVAVLKAGTAYRMVPSSPTVTITLCMPPTSNTVLRIDCVDAIVVGEHVQNDVMAICGAAEILGSFGNMQHLSVLESGLSHSSHHVRWASMTAIVQISPQRALELLGRLESDPHEHIRSAAKSTIDRLGVV